MRNPIRPRDLGAAEALLYAAILFVALFAWGASTGMLAREGLPSTSNWAWRLWQVGALLMGIPGVWWLWRGTERVVWTRGVVLGVLALVVFLNTYGDRFFEGNFGNIWKTVNPVFLGCALISITVLWNRGDLLHRLVAALLAVMGVVLFINAYFVNDGTLWEALNPLRALVFLLWSVAALKPSARPDSEMGG